MISPWYKRCSLGVKNETSYYKSFVILHVVPQWGTADAEIKAHSVESPELTNVLPLKPGVGQNIASDASPTARKFFRGMWTDSSEWNGNWF